jgi:hypothetical protein
MAYDHDTPDASDAATSFGLHGGEPVTQELTDRLITKAVQDALDSVTSFEPLLQFFQFGHLLPHLAVISQHFAELACRVVADLPCNPERTVALRKLLEAKDCAVRAVLYQKSPK